MRKLVVHTPKGGVGKTTVSVNLAMTLARAGKRVWALDLAQGTAFSDALRATSEFSERSGCRIEVREMERVPTTFRGSRSFDYLVADTDDYHKILEDVLDPGRRGLRMICPVVPTDDLGVVRVCRELREVVVGLHFASSRVSSMRIFVNDAAVPSGEEGHRVVADALEQRGLGRHLSSVIIPHCKLKPAPIFVDDPAYGQAMLDVLTDIGERI